MVKVKLKSIFGKDGKTETVLRELCQQMNEDLCVTDMRERVIFGNSIDDNEDSVNILLEGEKLGAIKGGSNIIPIAKGFLDALIIKEKEKKEVGSEVLDLYREINLIYNFSEQLADRINPGSIANLALDEANRIMKTRGGTILLREKIDDKPKLLADVGDSWNILEEKDGQEKVSELMQRENPEILSRHELIAISKEYKSDWGPMLYAPLKVKNTVLGIVYLIGDKERVFTAADIKLLTTIALQTASAIESSLMYEKQIKEAMEREETMKKVQEMTARFVPFEFLKLLGRKSLMETQLGDQVENVVTVVFLDIRKFTALAEGMTPDENFKFVNSFNARIGPVIKENQGFINQYLGDGVMALFPENPTHALEASIEILKVLQEYNSYRVSQGRNTIRIGIGIHTGPLIMGITGDDKRWEATTISDTVNAASRIESLTKFYKCNIILSNQSLERIDNVNKFNIRSLGRVQVKGRQKALRIYECFDGDIPYMINSKLSSLEHFNHGIESYENKIFRDSTKAFSQVLVGNPDDETAQCFLGRISNLLTSEFTLDWDGVDKMSEK